MKTWSELQVILQDILGEDGKAYYQPPENLKLSYPCIVFSRSNALIRHADNDPYNITKRYVINLITKTADNDEYIDKILTLPMCRYDRQMVVNGLVHDYFEIFY